MKFTIKLKLFITLYLILAILAFDNVGVSYFSSRIYSLLDDDFIYNFFSFQIS